MFKVIGFVVIYVAVLAAAQIFGFDTAIAQGGLLTAFFGYLLWKKFTSQPRIINNLDDTHAPLRDSLFQLNGVNDVLEIFDDRVTITPKSNFSSILIKGLKGTKTIPIASITAIQFRSANPINGYIQFSIAGGFENGGGVIQGITDENTVFFVQRHNERATEIRNYIETCITTRASSNASSPVSVADELQKLALLKDRQTISEEEFEIAKLNLLSRGN